MSTNTLLDVSNAPPTLDPSRETSDPLSIAIRGLVAAARSQGLLEGPENVPGSDRSATGAQELALTRVLAGGAMPSEERLLEVFGGGGRLLLLEASKPDCLSLLTDSLKSEPSVVAGTLDPGTLVVFVRNGPSRLGESRALHEARCISVRARRADATVVGAISNELLTARDIEGAFSDCREAIALGAQIGEPIVYVEQFWSEIVLRRVRRQISQCLTVSTPLTRLIEHDRLHGTDFLITLRTWLASGEDPRAAAHQLGIHVNTLRYRLRRITDLADLDLRAVSQKLVASLIIGSF
jgi:hypothetical protein